MLHANENKRKLWQGELFAQDGRLPPLTNRGVIDPLNYAVYSHLDFYSATYPLPIQAQPGQPLDHFVGNDLFAMERETHAVRHFRHGAQLFPAGRIYWNDSEGVTGSYVVLSGDEMAMVRQWHHMDDDTLLRRLARNAQSITRLDFAINVTAGDPAQCIEAFETHRCKTRVRSCLSMKKHGKAKGYTAYFGSKNSEKMVRVYDKAAELKLLHQVLTRIELQVRKAPALTLAKTMIKHGVKVTGKSAMRDFVDFPELDWYQQAVGDSEVEMNLTPSHESSFEKWLTQQVLPAIAKRWDAGIERQVIQKFSGELMRIQLAAQSDQTEGCKGEIGPS